MIRSFRSDTQSSRGWLYFAACMAILFPYLVYIIVLPIGRDSGVFLYTGMVINNGGMPYLDSWDHKGPLLYLFNAAGLAFGVGPRGVMLLEALLLLVAVLLSIRLWSALITHRAVLLVTIALAMTYTATFQGGNFTESWLLPFALASWSLFIASRLTEEIGERARYAHWFNVSIGITLAVAMLTRPNNGLGLLFIAAYALMYSEHGRWKSILLIAGSFAVTVLPVLAWLVINHALRACIEQYITFNLLYVRVTPLHERVQSAYIVAQAFLFSPLGVALTLAGMHALSRNITPKRVYAGHTLMLVIIAAWCIDALSQMLSGRGYLHYAMPVIPPMTLALVAALKVVKTQSLQEHAAPNPAWFMLVAPLVVLSMIPLFSESIFQLKHGVVLAQSEEHELVAYLRTRTSSADRVAVHGSETWLLAATERYSPTSITYWTPVCMDFGGSARQYQQEIINGRPLYLIETPIAHQISDDPVPGVFDPIPELRAFVREHYVCEHEIHGYRFWRRISGAN